MQNKKLFGEFIAEKRKSQGLTQRELAERLFVTESAVSKWERGLSYPDITLVEPLSEALGVTERELISAGPDLRQRALERDAGRYQRLVRGYRAVWLTLYGATLLICLICNLAIGHTVSWFWLVLFSLGIAFSVTTLPALLTNNRWVISLGVGTASLLALLLASCVYTGGDWFALAATSTLFGLCVVFLPLVLRQLPLPAALRDRKGLLAMAIDTVLLVGVVLLGLQYTGNLHSVWAALAVTAYGAAYAWLLFLICRYLPCNGLLCAALCLLVTAAYTDTANGAVNRILSASSEPIFNPVNLLHWAEPYVNGNLAVVMVLAALVCLAGGVACARKKNSRPE
jgi:transcriptional regulator with XRE-family HTH domain